MTDTPLVPVSALDAEIGPLDEADTVRASAFLAEASALAREIGSASWTAAGGDSPAPTGVLLIVKRAARRAFTEDPDGYTSEGLGDWSGRKAATDLDESGVFYTVAEEKRIAFAAGFRSGVGSIRTPSAYATGTEGGFPWLGAEYL